MEFYRLRQNYGAFIQIQGGLLAVETADLSFDSSFLFGRILARSGIG
jgi:hypothetical protein